MGSRVERPVCLLRLNPQIDFINGVCSLSEERGLLLQESIDHLCGIIVENQDSGYMYDKVATLDCRTLGHNIILYVSRHI